MPGYLVHLVVLDRAIERLRDDPDARLGGVGRILQNHPVAAATGSVGPDLTFFMDLDVQPALLVYQTYVEWRRRIQAAIEPLQTEIDRLLPNIDGLSGGMLGRLRGLFSAYFTTLITAGERLAVTQSDVMSRFKTPLQNSEREEEWFWFDMLHYRSTGRFGQELLRLAGGDDELKAYAYGYISHLAADTVGHAFVNAVVGAPYRCLWQRHIMVDKHVDAWVARRYWRREMLASQICTRYYPRPDAVRGAVLPVRVADLLATATRNVYATRPHPNGSRLGGREFPSATDFQNAYQTLFEALEIMTGELPMRRPEPPEFPFEDWGDLIAPMPHIPTPSDYDDPAMQWLAVFLWPVLLAVALKEYVEDQISRLMELAELPARHILRSMFYLWEKLTYDAFRAHHRALSLRGYAYCYLDELDNDEERALWSVPRVDPQFPHLEDADLWKKPWQWPDSGFEPDATSPGPFPQGSTPAAFIEGGALDEGAYAGLREPRSPGGVREATGAAMGTSAPPRPVLGNATDLFVRMVRTTLDGESLPNFNLDADRGYGWPCWSWSRESGGPAAGALRDGDILLGV